ncbi:hypothetical protein HT031_004625 [Scenedesmus sp. PABB004]|nr:hypothetical protein HT031_004625 [Scenedesmus sp. PABB004]
MAPGRGAAIAAAGLAAAGLAAAAALLARRRARRDLDSDPPLVLTNALGVEVHVLRVGAAIQRLIVPLPGGERRDVVLGHNRPSTYATVEGTPYFGAVVGRVANRIAGGRFTLDGAAHALATNNGPNALHGGPDGFHRRVFAAGPVTATPDGGSAVTLTYTSADGEEGYPGALAVSVTYALAGGSAELTVTMAATTDRPTLVNLAQHSYFNLAGHASGDVLRHRLRLSGDHYTPLGDHQIPTGAIAPVAGTPFDFTAFHALGERIDQVPGGYDHNFVLFGLGPNARFIVKDHAAASTPRLAATLVEPESGLTLEVLTTAPGVQLYAGGFLGAGPTPDAKDGAAYVRFAGVCLETQNFPDAMNQPAFPSSVLRPGEAYRHVVVYRLSTAPPPEAAAA